MAERGRVHDVVPGGALSKTSGCVDAEMLWHEAIFHGPQSDGSWSARLTFSFLVGTNVESCRDVAAVVSYIVWSGEAAKVCAVWRRELFAQLTE